VFFPYAANLPSHKPPAPAAGNQSPAPLAEAGPSLYINSMQKLAVILSLLALLAGSAWFAYYAWTSDTGPPLPGSAYVAMALGIVFSLVVGVGLMALVFYSHRHGYDERGQGRGQE
jgi:formate hydrogenlyase subunit 3/multisubunit Na+/H+ antiporter MnhD subunit